MSTEEGTFEGAKLNCIQNLTVDSNSLKDLMICDMSNSIDVPMVIPQRKSHQLVIPL